MCGRWCFDLFRADAKYAIFDDIRLTHIPNWKCWIGGQRSFVITGKYRAPRGVQWGRPCIFLGNDDTDPLNDLEFSEKEWFMDNIIYVKLDRPLFQ